MRDSLQEAEYNSIRTEMTSVVDRAFSFWKWGLVSLLSVYFSFSLSLAEMKATINSSNIDSLNILQAAFIKYQISFVSILMVFSIIFILLIAWIVCEHEKAADRLGSYLAVFYESERNECLSIYKKALGWHVWNRIEKTYTRQKQNSSKAPIDLMIYHQKSIYLYGVVLLLFVCLLFQMATVLQIKLNIWVLIIYLITIILVFLGIYLLRRNVRKAPTYWNIRWMDLLRLNDDEIRKVLVDIGLERPKNTSENETFQLPSENKLCESTATQ